ncbi:MAG: helicase [Litorilinea sp.]|nr:MAG: helicase [Litorilinea sp.]
MFVLHVHWQPPASPDKNGRLIFWAEHAQTTPEPADRRVRRARPHPFAATAGQVRALLARLTGLDPDGQAQTLTLQLPTGRRGPTPSPGLLHDWPQEDTRAGLSLRPWEIPGFAPAPADACFQLLRLPAPTQLDPSVRLGDTVRFWQAAARLLLEAFTQQKLVPTLEAANEQAGPYLARWQPLLDGPRDGPRLAQLRRAMPPLCRADASFDPTLTPDHLLHTFLNAMADALARRWAQESIPVPVTLDEPVQAWLNALGRQDPTVRGSSAQLRRLLASHRAWLRNLRVAGDRHFRVALRLEAPTASQEDGQATPTADRWRLHFLLQSRDDPSLLVPADQIWHRRGSALEALPHRPADPQSLLLTGLGYAARLFEPLRRSLDAKRPTGAWLSGHEAYTFLREVAPLLEESGFGVLVPPWWNQRSARLGVRLRLKGQGSTPGEGVASGLLTMENLVHFQWELALGGEPLSREEFEALVRLKTPLVQIRGQWVQLDPEQIEAAIRFWQKSQREGDLRLLDALQMGLAAEQVDGLPVEGVETEGWFRDWMAHFTQQERLELLPEPQGLRAQLRPYQRYGYSWLDFQRRWGIGAILADDMGLGKTIQTLAMLQGVKEQAGRLPGPVLLICPTSVVINWAKEAARFTPELSFLVHQGPNRLQGQDFLEEVRKVDLVATSYALVRRDAELLKQVEWFGVVLDEAQNIKNPETRQARIARSLPAGFRLALTGTPVENRLSELWSIMQFLNPGFLGSQRAFRQRFAIPIERYGDPEAAGKLRRLVSPFILRRVKTDPTVIQDLPEKQEIKAYCTLTEEQVTLYEAVVQESLRVIEEAEGMDRRGQVLSMLMKLKQICNHPAQFLHQLGDGYRVDGEERRSGKLARTAELMEELLAEGDRALVFTQFAEMGNLLRAYFQQRLGVPVLFLHGGTPPRQRHEMVERFQDDPDGPPIFVLSLKAGGTGLNLTRASRVFHFDRWWNPAVEDQATDRAFRIGQRQNVQVYKFVCVGTLEEKIDEMIEAKKALAESIVGSGENWLTELSTDELKELVTLRREMLA